MKKTQGILILVVLVMLFSAFGPVWAEESKITFGSFSEKETGRYDYSMNYAIVSSGKIRLQYDNFSNPNGLQRLWANYGSISLGKNVHFSPGIIVTNGDKFHYGGLLDANFNDRLHVHYKAYAGNKSDKHVVFTNYKLSESIGLQAYYYAEQGWTPDCYVGPTLNHSGLSVWGGISTTRPGAWATDLSLTIKF